MTILGTDNFCQALKRTVEEKLNINSTVCHAKKGSKTQQFVLHGNIVGKVFFDWLYKDATIYLQRKYDKYLEIKSKLPVHYYSCKICGKPNDTHGYCRKHYYEYIGKEKRRQRYLNFKK